MQPESRALKELITTLQQQRDELALKVHLARAELKDEWNSLEKKLDDLATRYEPVKDAAEKSAADVWESLKMVGEEVQQGFNRIRKSL